MIQKIKNSNTFIKYRNWEYWPMWMVYLPVLPLILFYALRARRWFFFSNVNPVFKTGALMGASKYQILSEIPERFRPRTIMNKFNSDRVQNAFLDMEHANLQFPIIVKPDIGERGLLVELIRDKEELIKYLSANDIDIIIQEYIDLPNECGIFYIRKPSEQKGNIVSIGLKSFFKIVGDGRSTVKEIMESNPRYKLQIERLEKENSKLLKTIYPEGNEIQIEPIGNHSRGTTFIDGNHLIDDKINLLFDKLNDQMRDVHYGRFDIKYNTWEELLEGKNLKILELNGVASEPIHVYDASVPIKDKYKSFFNLWKTIFEISKIQKSRGIFPIRVNVAYRAYKEYKNYIKSINKNWRQTTQVTY